MLIPVLVLAGTDTGYATAQSRLVFQNLTVDDGLPDNTIRAIIQDRRGFIWLGTQGGLVRYDGLEFRVFRPLQGDQTTVAGRLISCLLEDSRGRIWVGTILNGMCRYDPVNERFTRFGTETGDISQIPAGWIRNFAEDHRGRVWVATSEGRLFHVDPETDAVTTVIPGPNWPEDMEPQIITDVLIDSQNQVWITTRSGAVHVMDTEGHRLNVLVAPTSRAQGGPLASAEELFEGENGRIWIAGYGGVMEWNPQTRELSIHLPDPLNPSAAINNTVRITVDQSGVLWLGSEVGLQRFDPHRDRFDLYEYEADAANSLVPGPVVSVSCDATGMIWAGTWQGGLSRFEPVGSFFQVHHHEPGRPGSLHINPVRDVLRDRHGVIWVGTGTATAGPVIGGLNRLEPDGLSFKHIPLPQSDLHVVEKIAEAHDERLWIGTNLGLWSYDRITGTFTPHRIEDPSLDGQAVTSIRSLLVDPDGALWLGTRDSGLWRLHPDGTLARHYATDPDDERTLGSRSVMCLFRDNNDRLWVGTSTAGLHRYVPETDDFERFFEPQGDLYSVNDIREAGGGKLWLGCLSGLILFDTGSGRVLETLTERDGLPNDRVTTLLLDGRGRLWLSTSRGLSLFDPETRTVRNFDTLDGLPANNECCNALLDPDGMAFLPSLRGLITFRPDQFIPSRFEPAVVLTALKLFDEPVRGGPDSPLAMNVTAAPSLDLAHDQNVVGFSFASLDFRRPDLLRYRYRLRGYDAGWRIPEAVPAVTYTNLSPGSYTFEVEGTNRDGVWSSRSASLSVRVRHPWWASPLAYVVYTLAALLLLALVFRTLLRRARYTEILQLRKAEVEKLEELDRVKSRFFANISHEFRTPLTLIEGLLRRSQENPGSSGTEDYEIVMRNTRRLRILVEQLLDLARLESGSLILKWHSDDVVGFVGAVSSPFAYIAETRNINFETDLPDRAVHCWFDRNVVETVVANLLSNALRYAPEGESVNLQLQLGGEFPLPAGDRDRLGLEGDVSCCEMTIVVANTGTYIEPDDQDRVFDRFIKAASTSMDGNVGSGIGLALVKELVDFMGGSAGVHSASGRETSFWVNLPLITTPVAGAVPAAVTALAEDRDQNEALQRSRTLAEAAAEPPAPAGDDDSGDAGGEAPARPLVLIVEDHVDLRSFLSGELGGQYRIVTAADGAAGLEAARSHVPDLVISDVMMPKMDGFELLARLKSDPATDHVPVILLTAKADAESRKEGLRTGADDYLSKPLDPEELRIRAANLIEQRARLRRKYNNNLDLLPVLDLPLVSQNDRFLARILEVVEEKMEDENFNVEVFAREVGLSRTQLHRKLKALTGHSASYVIRRQRLRRAAQLLAQGYGNVAEVAYTVGFKSISHFSSNFKDEFGVAPSRYRENGDNAAGTR